MDLQSIIVIVVAIVIVYFFVKLVVSPLVKVVLGIITFLIALYVLQHFFNLNLNNALGPLSSYLNLNKWGVNLNWILAQVFSYINSILSFLHILGNNVPKQ